MPKMPKKVQAYPFTPVFERAITTLSCISIPFYGRVGYALDPSLMPSVPSQHAIQAAHQINNEVGHGPGNAALVLQRLRGWVTAGKLPFEGLQDVLDIFDGAEDDGLPDMEAAVNELTPILRQRMRDEAVQEAIASYGNQGDLSKVVELEEKAERIGQVDTSVGTILGSGSFADIVKLRQIARLPTGIHELDSVLDGGLEVGGLGCALGASGDGKSMMLSHVAGTNLVDNVNVAYATLELPVAVVLARVKANITGVPINTMIGGDIAEAQARLGQVPHLGKFVCQYFPPKATTIEDIKRWFEACEEKIGQRIELLVVDYADKLGAKPKKGEQQNEYTGALAVYEGLRHYAVSKNIFCWTASQATRQKDARKKILDLNDTADSMHKVRVSDLIVSLNLEDDGGEDPMVKLHVAKHRTGKSRVTVGPMPTDYACGRICPITEYV